jgi:hypothetical protein
MEMCTLPSLLTRSLLPRRGRPDQHTQPETDGGPFSTTPLLVGRSAKHLRLYMLAPEDAEVAAPVCLWSFLHSASSDGVPAQRRGHGGYPTEHAISPDGATGPHDIQSAVPVLVS